MLSQNERGNFEKLYDFFSKNRKNIYKLTFSDGQTVSAIFDTCYESDNNAGFDDPNFEEFISIVMRNTDSGELFEFNYHDMPLQVYTDEKRII